MKWKLLILLAIVMVLAVPTSLASSIKEISTGNWIVTKHSGEERGLDISIAASGELNLTYSKSLDTAMKNKLKNKNYKAGRNKGIIRTSNGVRFQLNKGDRYLKYGDSTIIIEEDNYWNLTNDKHSWYISKTGFQVSNFVNETYAQMKWELTYNGTPYNSLEQIWDWSYENDSATVILTGTAPLSNAHNWSVSYFLEDGMEMLDITLDTTDKSQSVEHRVIHYNINISSNDKEDNLQINGNDYPLDVPGTIPSSDYFYILDPSTREYIHMDYDFINDAIITIDQNVTLTSNYQTVNFLWVDPILPTHALIEATTIGPSVTSSSAYITIGIIDFELPVDSSLILDVTSALSKLGGSVSIASQRILLDGTPIGEASRELENNDKGSLTFTGHQMTVLAGNHTVTVQHKINTGNTLTSKSTVVVLNPTLMSNLSLIDHQFTTFSTTAIGDSWQSILQVNYTIQDENNTLFAIMKSSVTATSGNDIMYYIDIEGQQSTHGRRTLEDASDIGSISTDYLFEGLNGTVLVQIFARNSDAADTTTLEGDIIVYEAVNDGLIFNANSTSIESVSSSSDNFTIASFQLDVITPNNDVYTAFTSTVTKSDAGKRDIDYTIWMDDTLLSPTSIRENQGSSGFGAIRKQFVFEDVSSGIHNFTIRMGMEGGATLTVINTSFYAIEVENFNVTPTQIDSLPVTQLHAPLDLQILETSTVFFNCTATDNNIVSSLVLYHNASGTFTAQANITGSVNVLELSTMEIIPQPNKILWNCLSTDNANQSSFSELNRTFTLLPIPLVNITLINPPNNTTDSDGFVTFSYIVNATGNSTLYTISNLTGITVAQETLINVSGSNSFTPIQFLQNQSINWFINHTFNPIVMSTTFQVNIVKTQFGAGETIPPPIDRYSLNQCPIDTTPQVLLFMFFFIITFTIIIIAFVFGNGLLGIFGSMMLITMAAYMFICLAVFGMLLTGAGIFLGIFFLREGTKGKLGR